MEYIKKDITTVDMGIVAHGVNCQHKMASGVAKAIRAKWPKAYSSYMAAPKGKMMLGTAHIININEDDSLFVGNCYTQQFYGYGGGSYADIEAVRSSLSHIMILADFYNLPVYLPKIGCGLGGLDWDNDVAPIVAELDRLYERVDILVCEL